MLDIRYQYCYPHTAALTLMRITASPVWNNFVTVEHAIYYDRHGLGVFTTVTGDEYAGQFHEGKMRGD